MKFDVVLVELRNEDDLQDRHVRPVEQKLLDRQLFPNGRSMNRIGANASDGTEGFALQPIRP
jgi:hypothetical protein